jgi:hypothetical protein
MSTLGTIILIYGYTFSWVLIYLIDYGMDKKYQLIACGIAIIILFCYFLVSPKETFADLNYGLLTLPIIAVLAFNLAAIISWQICGREFRATWRGARDYHKEKKSWSDYLISFFIICIEFGWPILVAVLLKK